MKSWILNFLRFATLYFALFSSKCETELTTLSPSTLSSSSSSSSSSTSSLSTEKTSRQNVYNKVNNESTTSVTTKTVLYPRIQSLEPNYGPVSGGTRITIFVENMDCPDGKLQAILNESSKLNCSMLTPITCVTPPASSLGSLPLKVSCTGSDGVLLWNTSDPVQFTYMPDPVISSVYPTASIISGGLTQTVTGEYLDSVSQPLMVIYYDQRQQPVETRCSHHRMLNETFLKCPTGRIVLDGLTDNDTARTHPDQIQSTGKEFSMGFIFDGMVKYRKNYAALRMFYDPEIDPFKPETKDFLTSPSNEFTFTGHFPRLNFSEDDIFIRIGGMACVGPQIVEDKVICRAPVLPKSVIRYGPSELNTLDVDVMVGNVRSRLGHLHYTAVESFNVIMSVMIAVVAFIFLVSCCFGCITLCGGGGGLGGLGGLGVTRRTEAPAFKSMPNYDSSEEDPRESKLTSGKKRGKRGGTQEADPEGPIECVAMQYRSDRNGDRI